MRITSKQTRNNPPRSSDYLKNDLFVLCDIFFFVKTLNIQWFCNPPHTHTHKNRTTTTWHQQENTTDRTHFADNVLMEPVVSMSPARNSWYFVQAMLDVWTGRERQVQTTKSRFCDRSPSLFAPPPLRFTATWQLRVSWPLREHTMPSRLSEVIESFRLFQSETV